MYITMKNLLNTLNEVLHVLVGAKVFLRVVPLLFKPGVTRRVCQYETYQPFDLFTGFFILFHVVSEVCIPMKTYFTHIIFEHLICLFYFVFKRLCTIQLRLDKFIYHERLLNLRFFCSDDLCFLDTLIPIITIVDVLPHYLLFTLLHVFVIVLFLEGPGSGLLREFEPKRREESFMVTEMGVSCPIRDGPVSSELMTSDGGGQAYLY